MATDATGTPTSLGIRKYNTSADAPSGLGFNGAMDDIDALLLARVTKPAGIVSGEVPVWNGTTWVRSSATNIGPTSLGSGTPDATKFLRGDGAWAVVAATTYRKTTAKAVNTTVAATDLLNGEITIAAGAMGTTGVVRLTAVGDFLNNSGGTVAAPRLQAIFGGTTLVDTGAGAQVATSATRGGWKVVVEIINLGAANAQASSFALAMGGPAAFSGTITLTTGEGGGNASATAQVLEGVNPSTAVDTTAAKALVLNVINGSASAAYETKLLGALVEVI